MQPQHFRIVLCFVMLALLVLVGGCKDQASKETPVGVSQRPAEEVPDVIVAAVHAYVNSSRGWPKENYPLGLLGQRDGAYRINVRPNRAPSPAELNQMGAGDSFVAWIDIQAAKVIRETCLE